MVVGSLWRVVEARSLHRSSRVGGFRSVGENAESSGCVFPSEGESVRKRAWERCVTLQQSSVCTGTSECRGVRGSCAVGPLRRFINFGRRDTWHRSGALLFHFSCSSPGPKIPSHSAPPGSDHSDTFCPDSSIASGTGRERASHSRPTLRRVALASRRAGPSQNGPSRGVLAVCRCSSQFADSLHEGT